MRYRDKVAAEHPEAIDRREKGGVKGCPYDYGYEKNLDSCKAQAFYEGRRTDMDELCRACWDREMKKEERT